VFKLGVIKQNCQFTYCFKSNKVATAWKIRVMQNMPISSKAFLQLYKLFNFNSTHLIISDGVSANFSQFDQHILIQFNLTLIEGPFYKPPEVLDKTRLMYRHTDIQGDIKKQSSPKLE